jgi:hypothetical protein
MRRGSSLPKAAGALLLVGLLSSACGSDADPEDRAAREDPSSDESVEGGPVAGAGVGLDPEDVRSWCLAVTPEQLTAVTGAEVADVYSSGDALQTCVANFPGNELLAGWGTEPTKLSFDEYAEELAAQGEGLETETIRLGADQPALVAWSPDAPSAFAGTVADGRIMQVSVSGVLDQDADPEGLGEMARQVLAVYVD